MNSKSKYAIGIGSVVLAGTLAIGSIASAAGNDDGGLGGRRHRPHLTTEQKCEHQDDIAARVTMVQQRITDRLAELADRRAAAEAAGETDRVADIDRRVDRLEKVQQRVETRYGRFQEWATTHC